MIPIGVVGSGRSQTTTEYQEVVLADSPLAFYPMNELGGSTLFDLSGNARHGVYTGNDYIMGASGLSVGGRSVSFGISGGRQVKIYVPYAAWMNTARSWEFLFNARTMDSEEPTIIARHNNGIFDAIISPAGYLAFREGAALADSTAAISANTTYHVVLTLDGTFSRMYLNGTLISAEYESSLPSTDGRTNMLTIGSKEVLSGHGPFDGRISDVSLYNVTLTQQQITAHATAALNPTP